MAGINVNQITSMLAKLQPDSALQQYAQMHKNNPYIMALASSESNRRKELRSAAQAAQGMQQQPKVVDAALAQMGAQPMPEDVGIGQLRAPNMQQMADGGIAGYEGYDEGGMTYGQEPVAMMAEGGVARFNGSQSQFVQDIMGLPQRYTEYQQRIREEDARKAESDRRMAQRRQEMLDARQKTSFANYLFGSPEREAEGQAELSQLTGPTAAQQQAENIRQQDMAQFDAASNLYMTERAAKQTAAKPVPAVDNKVANKKPFAAPRPGAGVGPAAATLPPTAVPEQTAAQRYAAMQKEMGMGPEAGADLAWQRSQMADRMRAQSKGELEDFEKDAAARGKYGEAKEARLAKREDELGKRKDENTGLALLEAGLAIMSTPGKLAEAVGKGAQVGLKTYGAGLEKLRAAQEKMDDARDQIEEFRRNEANMTAKERRQFKSQINRTETEIEKMGVDAAEKMYGYKREDAKSVFAADTQTRLTGMEIGSREKIAADQERNANARSAAQIAATLNTPDRLVFNQLLKDSGNDAVKAAESLQKLKTEKFNVYDAYSKYLQAFAGKDTLKGPDDFEVFAKRFIPTVTPSKNTTIRTQPGG